MKTPHFPNDDTDFIPRRGTAENMAAVEEKFVGNTLLNAAEHFANSQGLELEDLLTLGRPLDVQISRPTPTGQREYTFFACFDESVDPKNNPALEYVLSFADTDILSLSELSDIERKNIRKVIEESEVEVDEDVLFLLGLEAPTTTQGGVTLTRRYRTYYQCWQQSLAIKKNIDTSYSINDETIATISYTSSSDTIDPLIMQDPLLQSHLMDLSVIEEEDVKSMEEILYYLNLPGGKIEADITADYLDDPRVRPQ